MTFNVASEVGQLRQAIVHRPGLELSRLTPDNIESLLFDDIVWGSKAKEEHDAFTESLREKVSSSTTTPAPGRKRSSCPRGATSCSTGCAPPEILGPSLVDPRCAASSRTSAAPPWPSSASAGS